MMITLFMFIKLLVTHWVIYESSEKVNKKQSFRSQPCFLIFFWLPFYVLDLVAEAQKDIVVIFQ